ncbi:NirD/YgiW/YdeI family stress tolerance protein [Neisseria sp. Ec49-e6-T10]|uniref:NirD/YgiW/YdeI family stress tolerance protein n=1 Tax=Neisseria sp. Ec49-e6-T10 TaxID=3140744 RepID=UPI003EBA6BC8
MKKQLTILMSVVTLLFSSSVFADNDDQSYAQNVTVTQAKQLGDETHVVLTGKIVKRLGDDQYLLRDSSGSIVIEIDDDYVIKVGDKVKVYGQIDKDDHKRIKIDSDRVTKL